MSTLTHSQPHTYSLISRSRPKLDILAPLRYWLNTITISNVKVAHLLCRLIPCDCPFERDITLFRYTVHIPPLCKLNPLYDEFISLRFRALSYLTDVCGEDVTQYIC